MGQHTNMETKTLEKIICNGCGKIIEVRNGMPMEGVFRARQVWEYMSGKDGEVDSFDLCEECYDKITKQFRIPLTRTELVEMV